MVNEGGEIWESNAKEGFEGQDKEVVPGTGVQWEPAESYKEGSYMVLVAREREDCGSRSLTRNESKGDDYNNQDKELLEHGPGIWLR